MKQALSWGLVGGGSESQIGDAHRLAARLDGLYRFAAGALDIDPERGKAFARSLGIAEDRAYETWQEMLEREAARPDPIDLVTVATPNATHFEISRAFLERGFHVLCEKPMTMTPQEAEALAALAGAEDRFLAVNFGYSGYAMVRQARAMVRNGELGRVRLVVAEFAHGSHGDAADADNPRVRWRYDPKQAGVSSVLADAGIHALHLASYVTDQSVASVSADFVSCVAGRELEDDAMLLLRYDGGAVGRLWTSAVAIGQVHGLNIRVFGETGGLRWDQESPNQLHWTPLGEPTRILERGGDGLAPEAQRASRITVGHPEGLVGAFGNLYRDLHDAIAAAHEGESSPWLAGLPLADAGVETVKVVHAAAESARKAGTWVKV
ncbi:MAG: Gfo/Idh/MocA family oxidoreductase [Kiloniellales bacterium]|nr:Gfo/Idh/MocA family oxidoreductase [Kiloniellales bacterium]